MCLSPRLAHLSSFFSSSFGSFIFLLYIRRPPISIFFFLNDTATPEIYPLPLHDALPISMGSDLFVYHGYADLSLEGRWVKATPAFNLALCTRFRVKPLEFDGRSDSIFHPFDADNRRHMEYLRDRGRYADVPVEEIQQAFRETYPKFYRLGPDAAKETFAPT